jgi:nucleotide-binding universal stress UspA family protein
MYQRILVPVDGSETSNKALVAALQLARVTGGRVRLIHVVEEMAYLSGYEQYGGYSAELLKVMRDTGTKVLNDGMAIAQAAGVEADNLLFDNFGGRLAEVVADAAKQWNADLIVVGTHGRRGVGRMLLGSGAEQILRLAPVPVLVIRSGEDSSPKAA